MTRPSRPPDVVLTGHFAPAEERVYRHVPFAVPAGVRQLHLRYDYGERIAADPELSGGNTLDVGLFDERGTAAGGPGFRGWSGSDRPAFTIDEGWATPPYRAGTIGAGRWNVLLGPYKVASAGLPYRVEIWFDPGVPPDPADDAGSPRPPSAVVPPAAEPGWVRGDLHCHTLASDGDSPLLDVLRAASAAGLDVLGVTDHNGPLPSEAIARLPAGPPVVLPGIEVTTYRGHWNAWGIHRWFEFRDATDAAVEAAMAEAVAAGAFVAVNHPKPFGPPWEYGTVRHAQAIEVWNGPWDRFNSIALARWDDRLRRDERLVAVGGSDTHHLKPPPASSSSPPQVARPQLGGPTTWVRIDGPLTHRSLLDGLRAGRCFISASPAGPELYLSAADGGVRVRAVGARGAALLLLGSGGCAAACAVAADDERFEAGFPPSSRYARAQLTAPNGDLLAVSNAVWA